MTVPVQLCNNNHLHLVRTVDKYFMETVRTSEITVKLHNELSYLHSKRENSFDESHII